MNSLIPKVYPLLRQAVENGVRYGYHRAYKYTDTPDENHIVDTITDNVLTEIFEWFEIPEENS